jgi:hypothetical protein
MTIDVQPFQPQIETILRDLGFQKFELRIEESVQDWAVAHGIREPSHSRTAMAAARSDGVATIVLVRVITPEMQRGVISGLEFRGFDTEARRLIEPVLFLEHLVLHEAAHLLLAEASEDDCDRWAFDRLNGRIRSLDAI